MKKTVLALTFLTLTTLALAQPSLVENSNLQNVKESYNNQTEKVPDFVGSIIGGETVNIQFEDNGTVEGVIGVKFDGLKIQNISDSEFENPTMNINVTQTALTSVIDAEKPYTELRNQLDEKNIQYQATNTGAGIKFTIFEALGNLASMLGLEF